jgi:hypothetical protein
MPESPKSLRELNFSKWLVENLRLTIFTFPEEFSIKKSYWEGLFGGPAENRQENAKTLQISETGPFENLLLTVGSNPIRVDWTLSSNPESEREWDFPAIGPLERHLSSFQKVMSQWLSNPPKLNRIAFGAVLRLPVSSREEGYKTLSPYLPTITLDPINVRNFLYQVNRPRKSNIMNKPDFLVNRLTRWFVEETIPLRVGISIGAGINEVKTIKKDISSSCRLDLDLSTSEEFRDELPKTEIQNLFQELVEFGMEIVREGDIQ